MCLPEEPLVLGHRALFYQLMYLLRLHEQNKQTTASTQNVKDSKNSFKFSMKMENKSLTFLYVSVVWFRTEAQQRFGSAWSVNFNSQDAFHKDSSSWKLTSTVLTNVKTKCGSTGEDNPLYLNEVDKWRWLRRLADHLWCISCCWTGANSGDTDKTLCPRTSSQLQFWCQKPRWEPVIYLWEALYLQMHLELSWCHQRWGCRSLPSQLLDKEERWQKTERERKRRTERGQG